MAAAAAAPKCAVCSHHHEQGVKCGICGHTGKSRFFQKLQNLEPVNLFAVRALDCFSAAATAVADHTSLDNVNSGIWSFVKMLRRHIFPDSPFEFADDSSCRHLIAFVGDAPIGVCRWRISPDATEPARTVVVLEHFGILEAKQKQGYGKQFLQQTIEDVSSKLTQMRLRVAAVEAVVPTSPMDAGAAAVHLFESCGFITSDAEATSPYVRMTLSSVAETSCRMAE